MTGKIILDQAQVGVWSDGLRGVVEMGLLLSMHLNCIHFLHESFLLRKKVIFNAINLNNKV